MSFDGKGIVPVRVSIIGSRGIPSKYGGFEVFTEDLSLRLVQNGYNVSVCCEHTTTERIDSYLGVKLFYFPFSSPRFYNLRKFYEILNDLYYMIIMAKSNDIMYILGVGTAGCLTFLPKIINKNIKIIINVDGVEWKREKFNIIERNILKFNNHMATIFADKVILDSRSMINYLPRLALNKTIFIPYGVEVPVKVDWNCEDLLTLPIDYNLIKKIKINEYWLVVARLEPENKISLIVSGFLKSNSKKPLVIIGSHTSIEYLKTIKNILSKDTDNRVLLVGAIYNRKLLLEMLRQNCFAYIHGHSVGGTNPSLLEAMVRKKIIIAHNNEFNREVCGSSALYFNNSTDLKIKIEQVESAVESYQKLKTGAYDQALKEYSWEKIIDDYISLFSGLLEDRSQ